ncbi:hypothetical protein ZEAMMB73_Zm00001d027834 [Zea mays]|uniref:Uncharacterized protein n=1 Tax=Zea mays TaxID=4577 RepID=A0A1D6JQ04_MAIZE|nr:hypothetical protein ZEAMMB73_Zm00001d027834 [Zea mays]
MVLLSWVAKNIASGLVLVVKSSSNDASRLTFWLSNTVVLREIIVQTFGISHQFTPSMMNLSMNGGAKKLDGKSMTMLWRNSYNGMQAKFAARQMPDDWQETSTLLATLEKIESWIFSRIVETIWWQVNVCLRMCPLSAGGHECGCLPILAKLVMEQCVARLNVAMFNAILRESSSEIPTDSISDPIVDPKVLPIPVGDLSFGSGAQLKNSVRA